VEPASARRVPPSKFRRLAITHALMMGGDAAVGFDAGTGEDFDDESSCSCRVPGAGGRPAPLGGLVLAGLIGGLLLRRRRRR